MRSRFILLLTTFFAWSSFAQIQRLELLTRSSNHPARQGTAALTGAPELSRDGRFVLHLSVVENLDIGSPTSSVPNLYLLDRESRESSLISVGLGGKPANAPVESWQISADNRRVLFETRASNLVPGDTNNSIDVFVRDRDLNQTILVTANTNDIPAHRGGFDPAMSADGNRVIFISGSRDVHPADNNTFNDVFLRDLAQNRTDFISYATNFLTGDMVCSSPAISDDGNILSFVANPNNGSTPPTSLNPFVADFRTREIRSAMTSLPFISDSPILSADGRFLLYCSETFLPRSPTNFMVRFSVETGAKELISSNSLGAEGYIYLHGVSSNGQTILFSRAIVATPRNAPMNLFVWQEGKELRPFPFDVNSENLVGPATLTSLQLSSDGKFATFISDAALLPGPSLPGFQAYRYDIENDSLRLISLENDNNGIPDGPSADPFPNADGSAVVFIAAVEEIDSHSRHPTPNIFVWDAASGQSERVSQSPPYLFENTEPAGAYISEFGAISDDGLKVVYASVSPADDISDTNRTWDIFLLDRATGARQLVSQSADGQSTGNDLSFKPIISGDGNTVAFLSLATNLVATQVQPRFSLYARDLQLGVTRLIAYVNFSDRLNPSVSFTISRDGSRIAFNTRFSLDARDSNTSLDVYLHDSATTQSTLVSYNSTETTAGDAESTFPTISPDGQYVAFRSRALNFGYPVATNSNFRLVFVRHLQSGILYKASTDASFGGANSAIQFDRASTRLFFGNPSSSPQDRGNFQLFTLSPTNNLTTCTDCRDASISEDGQWVAYVQYILPAAFSSRPVILRNIGSGAEIVITTNGISSRPRVTDDGRFVIFEGRASNIVSNISDQNNRIDLFLFDREQNRLDLISNANGATANEASQRPILSPDQSFVIFRSHASNLVPNDLNDAPDLFAAYLPIIDTDTDQLDDRWEQDNFQSLTHTGATDTDLDGLTDLSEFLAGSDPNLSSSTLRLTTTKPDANTINIRWKTVPGRAYQIQTTENLQSWQNLGSPIIASQPETILNLPISAIHTYFRLSLAY